MCSHEFLDKFNAALSSLGPGCSSNSQQQSTPARQSSRKQHETRPTLTADTLLRSQKEREAMVPTGETRFHHPSPPPDVTQIDPMFSQRLFKPVSRFPYVAQAQPSKNDSAVSSSFSSDANRARSGESYSLRMARDEQKRINPQLMATFPVSNTI